ncbi:hypothetical protein HK405_011400 [Cladochytrium tenue]|nr:hypothetical protein HK405_011400 [Cladochytrium tenue]
MTLDLLSLKSVDAFASAFLTRGLPLHGLILNAGIMATPFTLSADGIESQFATNHVAHFRLTQRLLDRIVESAPSRVVVVSAKLHTLAPKREGIRFDKISEQAIYKPWVAYGQSKLANILFSSELSRSLEARGIKNVYVNSLHPDEDQGASTSLFLATDPTVEEKDYRGLYFDPIAKLVEPDSKIATDAALAKKLWEFTEKLVQEKLGK